MQPRKLTALMLFISSYSPLFVIFAVKDWDFELLESKVSDNQRYLRKISTILNLGHNKNPDIMAKIKAKRKKWGLIFEGDQLVITDDTIDDILTVLQNKRLHSELTEEDFDVESVKKYDLKQ